MFTSLSLTAGRNELFSFSLQGLFKKNKFVAFLSSDVSQIQDEYICCHMLLFRKLLF